MQHLLQFYADSLETLHVSRLWSDDVHSSTFYGQSEKILEIMFMQLLLQFYADSFETIQVFDVWI